MFNKGAVVKAAKDYDSFYMYDHQVLLKYARKLQTDFEGVTFLYSNKTNPNPKILETVFAEGYGSDSASLNEVMMGKNLGLPKDKIYYSAPGKSIKDIEEAMDHSILIADSLTEIDRIEEIAKKHKKIVSIGVRINPDFGFYSEKGSGSKFGIDESILFGNAAYIKTLDFVKVVGIHIHVRSQELQSEVLKKYYENILNLSRKVQKELEMTLEFINLGSGIGINYANDKKELDTVTLGEETKDLIKILKEEMPAVQIYIESGRFVVTKCGVYVTKVLDKKLSYGETFLILNNTLNGFLRPSLAQLIGKYSSEDFPAGSEPVFTSVNAFDFIAVTDEVELEKVTLVGNLCTATDIIKKDITLPKMVCGDLLVITNAGSYAAVLSPMQFSSQTPPAELYLQGDGMIVNTRKSI